jgi:hypothetical protein
MVLPYDYVGSKTYDTSQGNDSQHANFDACTAQLQAAGAPAAANDVYVLQPGHQTPLDAADPFARANSGWVSNSDDPIANREWRLTYGDNVQEYLLAGVLP